MGAARAISGSAGKVCLLAAVLASAGCASPAPRADSPRPGAYAGNQGGAWEAVLGPRPLAAAEARRDRGLNVTEPGSVLALGLWPDPPRPSLDQTRQLLLINRPDYVHYFSEWTPWWRAPVRYRVYP